MSVSGEQISQTTRLDVTRRQLTYGALKRRSPKRVELVLFVNRRRMGTVPI
ncbi:hypothetical protein J6590_048795 [Homalodisca vitripennis]|nr:hypothetical protein J6590_048795 [Homalodisca vitripennis]